MDNGIIVTLADTPDIEAAANAPAEDLPLYDGSYEVYPSTETQTLPTARRYCTGDISVQGIVIADNGGTNDHSALLNRGAADQHPIAAITGLQHALAQAAAELSAHNSADDAHGDIRIALAEVSGRISAIADSDDITLDQLSEIVGYIKDNRELIETVTTRKVNVSDIINDLVTSVADRPLSAAQGVELKRLADSKQPAGDYLSRTELQPAIAAALEQARAEGIFDGADGYSPLAAVEQTENGAAVTITDKNGTTTAMISNGRDGLPGENGADGADGYSPLAAIEQTENGAAVTITDKNGTTTAMIFNGRDGLPGENGADGESVTISAVTESTEDGGDNIVMFSDGSTLTIRNGKTGATGEKGEKGDPSANLLHNADWAYSLVNQRGHAGEVTDAYCIDRWIGTGTVTPSAGQHVTLAGGTTMVQYMEILPDVLMGRECCFSMLVGSELHSAVIAFPDTPGAAANTVSLTGFTVELGFFAYGTRICGVYSEYVPYVRLTADAAADVKRVFLELGNISSMADTRPREYADNLLICQRYFVVYGTDSLCYPCLAVAQRSYIGTMIANLPCAMRLISVTPVITGRPVLHVGEGDAGSKGTIKRFDSVRNSSANSLHAVFYTPQEGENLEDGETVGCLEPGITYVVRMKANVKISFSAEIKP